MATRQETLTAKRTKLKGRNEYPRRLREAGLALRQRLLGEVAGNGAGPMSSAEIRAWVEEHRELWPSDREVDEFIAWVRKTRREGRKS